MPPVVQDQLEGKVAQAIAKLRLDGWRVAQITYGEKACRLEMTWTPPEPQAPVAT